MVLQNSWLDLEAEAWISEGKMHRLKSIPNISVWIAWDPDERGSTVQVRPAKAMLYLWCYSVHHFYQVDRIY